MVDRRVADVSLASGVALVVLFALLVTAQSVVLILGGAVTPVVTMLSPVAVLAALWFVLGRSPVAVRVAAVAIACGAIALSVVVATLTTDRSWDGNTYHKLAVGALRAGWNPVWAPVEDWAGSADGGSFAVLLESDPEGLWIDAYPKATWLFGASLAQVTGSIESGKAFTLLMMIALFLVATGYLATRMRLWSAVLIGAVAAANPIAVTQVFTYYNDGLMGTVVLIAVVLLSTLVDPGWDPPLWWRRASPVALVSTVVVLANVKFTGLVHAGILGLVFLAWLCVRLRANRRAVWALAGTGLAGGAIALVVVGASSYLRNLVTEGNPLHPLFGRGTVDILTHFTPVSFVGRDPVSRFAISVLSTASNSVPPVADLKVPFTFTGGELHLFRSLDVRIGGWGVLFGGVLIVSVLLGVYLLIRFARTHRRHLHVFLLPIAAMAIGVVAVDGSWWARYTPHLVVVSLVVLVALAVSRARALCLALSVLVLANSALIGAVQVHEQWIQRQAGSLSQALSSAAEREGCIAVTAAERLMLADPPDPDAAMFGGAVLNALEADGRARVMTRDELLAREPGGSLVEFDSSGFIVIAIAPEPCG